MDGERFKMKTHGRNSKGVTTPAKAGTEPRATTQRRGQAGLKLGMESWKDKINGES